MKRYHLIATNSIQIPRIYSIGFADLPSVTRYGPSVRNQYIIHYILSGKGVFNGHPLKKGEGFLITPGMKEEYYPDKNEPWSYLWIISEDMAMKYFFDAHKANKSTNIFEFHNLIEISEISELLKKSPSVYASSTQLSELFLHIFHSCIESKIPKENSLSKHYFEFSVNYIKTNLHLPITVEGLCQVLGISQPYLYRIFKQETGISPKKYILNCKLTRAKALLSETELSVSHISDSVGFQNVLDFSKFFSKQTRLSPTAYRNMHR